MNAALTLRDAVAADLDEVRALFREYEAWLQADLCFQGFEEELATLPGKYVPPKGRLLLAELDGRLAGVIALREFGPGVCEMKRLFVREFARGHRVGRALAERLVAEAKVAGYGAMRLDTMPDRMGPANALYEALGFRDIPAYYANPIPDVRYMELDLTA
jgi:ribosomal protein S18 acetylase RimI-like enzyme